MSIPASSAADRRQVIGYLAEWDQDRGFQTIQKNVDVFTGISPFWYRLHSSGNIVHYIHDSYEDPAIIAFLRSRGVMIIPTIANIYEGVWDADTVSRIINDGDATADHVNDIVNLVVSRGFDGIDIDYEALRDRDRDAFSNFIQQLAAALHDRHKILTVDVYAKTAEPGDSSGARAQNWEVIGQAADQVRIMAYNYHWTTSPPGSLAPIDWMDQVAAFAVSKIPKDKIILGFALYGIDWVGNQGKELVWQEVMNTAITYEATINWDATSMSAWFQYIDADKVQHTVWFESGSSIEAKLDVVNRYDIGGAHFWSLGGDDPQTWQVVGSKFGITITPPALVSIQYLPVIYTCWSRKPDLYYSNPI